MILAGLVAPDFTRAQTDQRCWLEKDCLEQRKFISLDTLSDKDLKAGFIVNTETVKECGTDKNAAGQRIGFCLPAGQAETAISFGGKRRFANMGEFIAEMYRYGTWAATIIAVFMILISGIQWMVSGGNSTMIDAAKHRIGGAIIGLVLLALSYTILGMLNPYLVNFRLPAVWLINEIEISPPSCNQLQPGQKILQMSKSPDEKLTLDDKEEFYKKNKYSTNFTPIGAMTVTKCGFEYLVEDAGAQTCTGTMCVDSTGNITKGVCAPYDIVGGSNLKMRGSNCQDADVVIHLKLNAVDQQFFNGSWLVGATEVQKLAGSKVVVEAPEWLDDDDKYIYYSCNGGESFIEIEATKDNHLWIDKAKPQKATKTTLEVPGMFNEYELHYYNLDKIKCAYSSKLGYVILKLDIELSGETGEPSLYIGRNGKTNQAILGTALDVAQFAIPLDDIYKGGIYLEGQLDRSVLNSIGEKPDTKLKKAK